ncbi:MAG: hypothetical protein Kow00107_02130 [Planctomycetota bacterium]
MFSCKLLVVYDSDKGATKKMAESVRNGAASVRNILAECKHVSKVSIQDMLQSDAFAFGTPNHFGTMSSRMKEFFRKLQPLWEQGALRGKPACVFTASGKFHGGAETALLSLMFPLFAHGMILIGLPPFPRSYISDGCFLGVKALIDRSKTDEPDEDSTIAAKLLGERLARTVLALNAGRECVKQYIVDEQKTDYSSVSDRYAAQDVERLVRDGDVEAWQCLNCGYVHNGENPPEQCPVCNLGVEYFTAYDVDAWECTSCGYVVYSARPTDPCPVCKAPSESFMPYKG